ncbi:hypothetical protein B0T16DRAFT_415550 [Cercophora newfieldiana]|uniref:Uncharacterized protein n=1 Tax=Cercophora newfieldiana TaxID=92897 RepID=A0AA40CLE3_9PEZI|nr:hypothetical protein B0T16DRAFT_415550 [Cercophora newfieldiana]
MLAKLSALAVLALAAQAVAEHKPYKPQFMKTSVRDLFGVVRRQDQPGYKPSSSECGVGPTCAAACGAGYETCASTDEAIHCFNKAAQETCCPNLSGDSCDAGFYCTSDKEGETWCCPNALDVKACAAAYSVAGGLVSQTAKPTSSSIPPPRVTPIKNGTYPTIETVSSSCTSTIAPSAGFPGSNATAPTFAAPTASQTNVQQGAGQMVAPAGALALLAAGIAALL